MLRHHRYWTGLGLLVRCCLFTIFSSSYNIQKNLFWISFSVIFMIAIRQLFKVYQKKTTNSFTELQQLLYVGSPSLAVQLHIAHSTDQSNYNIILFSPTIKINNMNTYNQKVITTNSYYLAHEKLDFLG